MPFWWCHIKLHIDKWTSLARIRFTQKRNSSFHSETKLIVSSNAYVDGLPLVITLGSEFGQRDQSTNFRVLLSHWIEKASSSISVNQLWSFEIFNPRDNFLCRSSILTFCLLFYQRKRFLLYHSECVWIHRRWYVLANQLEISYYYFMVSNFFYTLISD